MKEWVDINKIWVFLIAAVMMLCLLLGYVVGGSGTPVNVSVGDAKIQIGEDQSVPLARAIAEIYERTICIQRMDQDVNYLLHYTRIEMVRHVIKQYDKIRQCPNDVKMTDVVRCLEDWSHIPKDYKTGDLPIKYHYILDWYQKKARGPA